MLGSDRTPPEAPVGTSLRVGAAVNPAATELLSLAFHCYQVTLHGRGRRETAMLEETFARHTGRKEVRAMAQTAAEAMREEFLVQATQENVLEVLEARFGRVPVTLARAVRKVKHPRTLKRLVRQAAVAESLAAFRATLPKKAPAARPRRRDQG